MDATLEEALDVLSAGYDGLQPIGGGLMASVFRAVDRATGRAVAVKVLDPMVASRLAHDRFVREVELCRRVEHPGCVPIVAVGDAGGLPYYVMPFFAESLSDRLGRVGILPLADALAITRDVAEVLALAHSLEVVHRDIKPANILMAPDRAVVADFGIAKAVCEACGPGLTLPGVMMGTPAYMSPEQAFGAEIADPRTDVYSLGWVLFEMLVGSPPDSSRQRSSLRIRLPRTSSGGRAGRRVERLLGRMLRWEPTERPSAAAVLRELERLAPIPAEPQGGAWWRHLRWLPTRLASLVRR
ncbi:MAG: serine/threonine-protein kinase [Gemmatimonadales bacterium]